jgi:tetratricopeptide (TPR) repeat protein
MATIEEIIEAAVCDLDRIIANQPGDLDALFTRGILLRQLGRVDAALRDLNQVLALRPNLPEALDERGQAFSLTGRLDAALGDFLNAAELESTADRHYRCGVTLSCMGNYQNALSQLDKAISLNPGHVEALSERGVVRMEFNQTSLARDDLDAALRLDPNYHIGWANRSAYFYLLGEWAEAIKDASRAIEIAPGYSLAYKLRALAANELGRAEEVINDLKEFFVLEPDGSDRRGLEEVLHSLQPPSQPRNGRGWLSKFLGGR